MVNPYCSCGLTRGAPQLEQTALKASEAACTAHTTGMYVVEPWRMQLLWGAMLLAGLLACYAYYVVHLYDRKTEAAYDAEVSPLWRTPTAAVSYHGLPLQPLWRIPTAAV